MNAIEYKETRFDAAVAVLGSLFLHILMFLTGILWISFASYAVIKEVSKKKEKKKDQVVLLSPEYFKRMEPKPVIEKKSFVATNPEITEAEVKTTPFIGEKSTLAASETALEEGDPALPTQLAKEEEKRELPNTFNSNFVDSEIERAPSPESVETQEQAVTQVTQSEEISDTQEDGAEEKKSLPAETLPEKIELVESPTQVETPVEMQEEEELVEKKTEGKSQSEEGLPKPKIDAKKAASGFQTQKKKTRIIGSLSRDGASSLKVQRTALGQYYAQISKIIEKKWQTNCLQYREHIQPGVISMQFYVDPTGKVSNPRPHDVVSTSPIQVGFTMKAIRASKLPPMPAAAKKELDGEKLELIYNFYF